MEKKSLNGEHGELIIQMEFQEALSSELVEPGTAVWRSGRPKPSRSAVCARLRPTANTALPLLHNAASRINTASLTGDEVWPSSSRGEECVSHGMV